LDPSSSELAESLAIDEQLDIATLGEFILQGVLNTVVAARELPTRDDEAWWDLPDRIVPTIWGTEVDVTDPSFAPPPACCWTNLGLINCGLKRWTLAGGHGPEQGFALLELYALTRVRGFSDDWLPVVGLFFVVSGCNWQVFSALHDCCCVGSLVSIELTDFRRVTWDLLLIVPNTDGASFFMKTLAAEGFVFAVELAKLLLASTIFIEAADCRFGIAIKITDPLRISETENPIIVAEEKPFLINLGQLYRQIKLRILIY
jgi:hypothetical protein